MFAQTGISQCLQTDLLCSSSVIVLFHACTRGLFDMLLIFYLTRTQTCWCKEMFAVNCTHQNEVLCRLSAGQQSTEPEPAVRLTYEEILRVCALLLKVRALLTFWMSLVKVVSLSYLFYKVFINKAAFIKTLSCDLHQTLWTLWKSEFLILHNLFCFNLLAIFDVCLDICPCALTLKSYDFQKEESSFQQHSLLPSRFRNQLITICTRCNDI